MYSNRLFPAYHMSPNPPTMMSWDDYEAKVTGEWQALLNSAEGCDEPTIHNFLVKNPSWLPGARGMNIASDYAPHGWALLSESPLREWVSADDSYCDAVGTKIPDFIWLASDSNNFTPVLIEIESPCKKWFTDSGNPHHDLVQAMNQLAKWRAWFNQPANKIAFCADFGMPHSYKNLKPEFVLIYGRRKEFQGNPDLNRLRTQFEQEGQVVMTFDRLKAVRDCAGYICAAKTGQRYRALSVPPTMRLGPSNAGAWCQIHGLPEAISTNEWISLERRQFLIKRLLFWTGWARSPGPLRSRVNWEDWE